MGTFQTQINQLETSALLDRLALMICQALQMTWLLAVGIVNSVPCTTIFFFTIMDHKGLMVTLFLSIASHDYQVTFKRTIWWLSGLLGNERGLLSCMEIPIWSPVSIPYPNQSPSSISYPNQGLPPSSHLQALWRPLPCCFGRVHLCLSEASPESSP